MDGNRIASIYSDHFGPIDLMRGEYVEGKRIAIWLRDPLTEDLISFITQNAPSVTLRNDEMLVQPRKSFRSLIEPILATGLLEDTGQRLRIGFTQMQVWKLTGESNG